VCLKGIDAKTDWASTVCRKVTLTLNLTLNCVSSVLEAVRGGTVGRELPFRRHLSAEAEESSLLKAITRARLVKTQQAGKGLAGAVVICKISDNVKITYSYELCV
jgi:hypothetical protein